MPLGTSEPHHLGTRPDPLVEGAQAPVCASPLPTTPAVNADPSGPQWRAQEPQTRGSLRPGPELAVLCAAGGLQDTHLALSLKEMREVPGGQFRTFWEPEYRTSMPGDTAHGRPGLARPGHSRALPAPPRPHSVAGGLSPRSGRLGGGHGFRPWCRGVLAGPQACACGIASRWGQQPWEDGAATPSCGPPCASGTGLASPPPTRSAAAPRLPRVPAGGDVEAWVPDGPL